MAILLRTPHPMQSFPVIGLPIAATNYQEAIDWILERALLQDKAYAVEAANTHVAALTHQDAEFAHAMEKFDLICPDGMPLVWVLNAQLPAAKRLTDRVYGPTLMQETFQRTNQAQQNYRHFLLGGKESTIEKLQSHFGEKFPHSTIVASYSPPFGTWPADETTRIADMIRQSGANLVWVGLGCPKQEKWIAQHKHLLPPAVYFGIGAAFAFHAGEVRQAPRLIQKIGMEWLFRLLMEPRRLFKRYFTYNSIFAYQLFRDLRKD
jgi:N-acetylglucosaminyldiphosphoundecaprenol N-acetyl-beta-D-mannosaminyltransferase